MTRPLLLLFCAAATAAAAPSTPPGPAVSPDLSVTARMEKPEFVRGETIRLVGTIRNSGKSAFVIDDYGDWIRNAMKVYVFNGEDGRMILPRRDAPHSAVPELTVLPGSEKEFAVDLSTVCNMPPTGRFQAAAIVTIGGTGGSPDETAGSRRVSFSVVDGIELKSTTHVREDVRGRRPLRFSLLYWDQAARQNLFLRVTDAATGDLVAFYRLGAFLRVAEPSLQFGENATVTVIQQISRDRFAKTVLSYASGDERVVSRDDNLVSADAFSDAISSRIVNERVDKVLRERNEEKKPGFFSRRVTRTPLPPSSGTPAAQEPSAK